MPGFTPWSNTLALPAGSANLRPNVMSPQLAALPDGRAAFVVREDTDRISLVILSADGASATSQVLAEGAFGKDVRAASLAALPDGTLAIAFVTAVFSTRDITLHTLTIPPGGVPGIMHSRQIDNQRFLSDTDTLSLIPDGDGFVAATSKLGGTVFHRVDSDGELTFLAEGTEFANDAELLRFDPSLVALPGGRYALAQEDIFTPDNGTNQILLRSFGADFVEGAPITISSDPTGAQRDPSLARLEDGRLVVVWTDTGADALTGTVMARLLDGAGQPLGSAFVVAAGGAGTQSRPQVIVLADGGFVVTWEVSGGAGRLQRFDAAGLADGAEFVLPAGAQRADVALLADGRLAVAWVDAAGAYARILDTREDAVDVVGGVTSDAFFGTAFDDALSGGAGADSLHGAAGDDLLLGGAGEDVLDGGVGADVMRGDADDDRYVVDDFGDVVIERPGGGGDAVDTTLAAYVLAANVEALFGVAPNGQALTGNALDNLIHGAGGGNDTLDGLAGADTMLGGAGHDVYSIRDLGDQIVELVGQGYDRVVSTRSWTLVANTEALTLAGRGRIDGAGNDLDNRMLGNAQGNWLGGYGGADAIFGQDGDDMLVGDTGNDRLFGGAGGDRLLGGMQPDHLDGGDGNDTLVGGAEHDRLLGGAGADIFFWEDATEGRDRLLDLESGHDRLAFSATGFGGGLTPGLDLAASGQFVANGTGLSEAASGQFVHDTVRHHLWWDADGTGAGARQLIAILPGPIALHASDLIVVA